MSQPPNETQPAGAYAVPVQPLQYVLPDHRGRPGLITAIGVISIIVASIGMLAALFTVLQAGGYYMMSLMSTSMAGARARSSVTVSSFPPPVPVQGNGAASPLVGPSGMGDAERRAAVRVLTDLRPMTPRRKSQLDAILAQAGKDMATDHVTDSGTMPETRSGEAPPDYFVTPAGRLEVFNERAVFFPSNNSPTVRVSAPPAAAVQSDPVEQNAPAGSGAVGAPGARGPVAAVQVPATGPTTTASPMPGALTPAEVQAVVKQAQSVASTPLNPAQVAGLQGVLAAPGQQLVPPGSSQGAVLAVYPSAGSAVIQFSTGGSLTLAPTGTVSAMMTAPVMPTILINPVTLTAMAVTAVVSLGLAVYLLICGIMALRQSPRARRWHLIYAGIKLPLAVAGAVTSALVARDMMASMGAAGRASTWGFSLFSGAVPLVLGCAYPVALLIALNLKQVKDYYAAGGAGQGPAA